MKRGLEKVSITSLRLAAKEWRLHDGRLVVRVLPFFPKVGPNMLIHDHVDDLINEIERLRRRDND